ncbi:hypothetical protein M409DRAFT_18803 [Zasmidium cellare ATCC 36951]|uniref:Uncharacterized protein n=1 Tax=Zasmidium cellare ATCC 36951 TaxID=1080233 RepID=A0A6A6CX97_ZASCE|nr:uncharacterized protein M409DRAFT_18803 [Zasmidium cellare ATCC 36951]KAF2170830.1 hypothetical protein M409DRAFT_18803 [Zasmidium cellare ATCC 36951]
MSQFHIHDTDLAPLKDRTVLLTGGSSGIGLATTQVLLSAGAYVVVGDTNPCPITHARLTFKPTNVTIWRDLLDLFALAQERHARIDHVFANAGISGRTNYLDEVFDEGTGELKEPTRAVYEINLMGMINTSYLALHYMRRQDPPGGSIVCTASGSSFQRFGVSDYTTTKHGVLGWMRGVVPNLLSENIPVRINCIGPSWTITGLVPQDLVDKAGVEWQPAEAVGRQVAYLMSDGARNGQFIYSSGGRNYEIEESVLLPAARKACGVAEVQVNEQEAFEKLKQLANEIGFNEGQKASAS